MIDSFIFSLGVTAPVFLVIVVGMVLRRIGVFTESYAAMTDRYVFQIALPVLLFKDISAMDMRQDFNVGYVFLCVTVSVLMFLLAYVCGAVLLKDRCTRGSFAQSAARGSAAILGVALVENIYGEAGLAPMMILAAVPIFNIMSVVLLALSADGGKVNVGKLLRDIVTNPIIIGAVLGAPFSLFGIALPEIASDVVSSVAATATPMALLAIGASFDLKAAGEKMRLAAVASAVKLLLLPALFLPVAVLLGFRDSALVSFFVMVGAPTTVAGYVMAKNMKGDHVLTSNTVMLSTLLSSFSITLWVFLMRSLGLI